MYAPVCHNNNLLLPSAYSLLDLDLHCEESAKKMIFLLSASDYLHLYLNLELWGLIPLPINQITKSSLFTAAGNVKQNILMCTTC